MEWGLCRVVPPAAVTTHAESHARHQLARDLEVERVAMGQRCRPQIVREVQRGNSSATSIAGFLLNHSFPAAQLYKRQSHTPGLACP